MPRTNVVGTTASPGSGAQRCAQAGEREHINDSTARTATATAADWNSVMRLRLRVAPAEPCPLCGIPYGLIRLPPACDICGAAPCLNPSFCDAYRPADTNRRRARR
jgi:hypothetical protein